MIECFGSFPRRIACGALLVIHLLAGGSALAQADLRYPFNIGDSFVHDLRLRVGNLQSPTAGVREYAYQLRGWVLERQEDVRTLLLELVRLNSEGRAETVGGGLVTLDSRGVLRVVPEFLPSVGEYDIALSFFPSGPHALNVDASWLTDPDLYGRQRRCTRIGPDAARDGAVRVDFSLVDPTGVSDVLKQSEIGAFWYDEKRGGLTRMESLSIDPAAGQRRELVALLRDHSTTNGAWIAKRRLELDRLTRSLRMQARIMKDLLRPGADADGLIRRADRIWSEFDYEFPGEQESPVRRLGGAARAAFAGRAEQLKARAALADQWVGRAATPWSLLNERGESVTSESLRDRATVECLWSAAVPGSLRMLETLRRLQQQIPDEALHIICMNVDADAQQAQRAIELAGAGLTHVLIGPPLGTAGPPELPLLRLIGRRGKVQALLAGWSPSVCDAIVEYLPETKEAATCR